MKSISATEERVIDRDMAKRSAVVAGLPYYYEVHLNNPCNQKCIMCMPNGKHRREEMSLDDFQIFFDRIRTSAEALTLIGGEPLLYRWIAEVLELLAETRIAVTLITNATALTEEVSRRLLTLHQLNLRCSIDAATRQTYLKIHGTDHFDRVTRQLRSFTELASPRSDIRLIMNYVVMRENLGEVLSFVDFAKPFRPHRIEFHPVRHVLDWQVENDTGWEFKGWEQSCETFKDNYNEVMSAAKIKCETEEVPCEILLLE
jgi:molybdenum cofactor biosynthesis enzyme MoaA